MWRHHLYLFFGHCTAKNKDIALKLCMRVGWRYLDHIYSISCLIYWNILDFIGNYFDSDILNFGGQNREISNIRHSHLVERSILHRFAFFVRLTSKLNNLAAFKHLPFSDPKLLNMTSLKRHFVKNISTDFSVFFCGNRQIDVGKGTESFASISAAVFQPSRKSGMERGIRPSSSPRPQRGAC